MLTVRPWQWHFVRWRWRTRVSWRGVSRRRRRGASRARRRCCVCRGFRRGCAPRCRRRNHIGSVVQVLCGDEDRGGVLGAEDHETPLAGVCSFTKLARSAAVCMTSHARSSSLNSTWSDLSGPIVSSEQTATVTSFWPECCWQTDSMVRRMSPRVGRSRRRSAPRVPSRCRRWSRSLLSRKR